jgi:acyl-coenzyme A thioesterase PaaI-like protein
MDFPKLPIADFLDIRDGTDGRLLLPASAQTLNHIGTTHAGAQFVLAETASGRCLRETFPDLYGCTLPVLRRSEVKFRAAGLSALAAQAAIDTSSIKRFREEISQRGRSMVNVRVSVTDTAGTETLKADFEWFVQRLPEPSVTQPGT